ncbi:hypothetical protein AMBR_CKHPCMOK_00305 [Lacticaseibacillus rhamnosus]|nr:hypothetical protein AMBR_NBBOBCOC_02378 [Lacticaseibacillus rhamnosus]VTU65833.1 hypothetical protein AMBR_CKHPCMOK_00305 [Lacticaseibacillus rhamnosus]
MQPDIIFCKGKCFSGYQEGTCLFAFIAVYPNRRNGCV